MKKRFIPLITVAVLVSIIFAGCMPGAPEVTPPPVTPPPVTPPPVTPPPVTPPPVTPPPVTPPPVAPPEEPLPTVWTPIDLPPALSEMYAEQMPEHRYWTDVVDPKDVEVFMEVVSADPVPLATTVHKRFKIAFIFPSLDLSDAMYCGWMAMEERLREFNVDYELTVFGGGHEDHALQASHMDTCIAQGYDYVNVLPTELAVQKVAIERMIEAGIKVIIWNVSNPFKDWGNERWPDGMMPLVCIEHCHGDGGVLLGQYAANRLEPGSQVAIIHGIPGIVTFCRCTFAGWIMEEAGHEVVYEHYAYFDKDKSYEAAKHILTAYPDVDHIHCCSTGTAFGAIAALKEMGMSGEILINGWGGGAGEQAHMWAGELDFTIMRMVDDWGVVAAEAIKYDIEGRQDEIPLVVVCGMVVIDDTWTKEQVDRLMEYSNRYSGVVEY